MAILKTKVLPAVLVLFLIASPALGAEDKAPAKALQAAENGLAHFLSQIPKGKATDYGLPDDFSAGRVRLLPPFRLYEITPQALLAGSASTDTAALLRETDSWYFPVEYEGAVHTVLVVARMPEGWKAVSFGYRDLGGELSALLQQWPRDKGYSPKLIAVHQAKTYLFTVPEHGPNNLTPLSGAVKIPAKAPGLKYAPANLSPLADTVERLKPIVSENLKAHKP